MARTSDRPLADYRVSYLRCRDPECQWRGVGHFTVVETISPSGIPNPAYKRQMAERLRGIYRLPPDDLLPETLLDY